MNTMLRRLAEDESAVTFTEYLVVTVFLAFVMVGFSRLITEVLGGYLRRIYQIVVLPVP